MDIIISNASGVPIYEQIVRQIKGAILSGQVSEGEALPSIRLLARWRSIWQRRWTKPAPVRYRWRKWQKCCKHYTMTEHKECLWNTMQSNFPN